MSERPQPKTSSGRRVELILQQLNTLPTLPTVAARLLQVTVKSSTQASEVVRLIESDPALSAKIIRLASVGGGSLRKATASVSKAVVLLGFEAVRNAVLSIKVFETMSGAATEESTCFDRAGFWRHSLATACAARMLAERIGGKLDPEEAFLCGLLHDIGKIALDTCLPKSFQRVVEITEGTVGDISEVEMQVLGLDHTVAGKRLAERWGLPGPVVETVWLHQEGVDALPEMLEHRHVVQVVHVADALARELRLGYSGNHGIGTPAVTLASGIGCGRSDFERVSKSLCNEISERAGLIGLDSMPTGQLYHEALGEANEELGRLNDRLRSQNERLERRSRYFKLLEAINAELGASASVEAVCGLVGRLWHDNNGQAACCVYAMGDDGEVIEGVLHDGVSETGRGFFVEVSDTRTDDDEETGFAVRTMDPHKEEWLLDQVAPDLAGSKLLRIPLLYGGHRVGALLWESKAAPAAYRDQLTEMQGFAMGVALALRQAQAYQRQNTLCEQLTQVNRRLQQSQQKLLEQRTLAAVGEMACGAAHEINNPLSIVVGRAQLLAASEEDDKRREMLEAIARQGSEASAIVSEMMELATPTAPALEPHAPGAIVAEAAQQCREEAEGASVQIEVQEAQGDEAVYGDAEQLTRVLRELLLNAIDAYEGRGGVVQVGSRYDEWRDQIAFEVRDKGCGMDAETLGKALAPFFSAKKAGRRRGLGLSRSARLAEANGGQLLLDSELGKGTTVRLVVPVATAEEECSSEQVVHSESS